MLLLDGLQALRDRLPPGWTASEPKAALHPTSLDATLAITAPDGRTGLIDVKVRPKLDPKDVRPLIEATRDPKHRSPVIVFARYLGERTRQCLREGGIGHLDLTGNIRIVVPAPGLYIETQGALEDPDRTERPARSLRGAKAGRLVRALVDRKTPPGVRELATLTKTDPGYVSRVLALLETEALITRVGRGHTESVDWPALLRRWAHDAPMESRASVVTCLEPRGLTALVSRLAGAVERYAVTGGLAAAAYAPTAPTRLGALWVGDAVGAATRLGLRRAESGANVLLLEPGDEAVFEGSEQRDGVWYAAPSQIAADLLTSPGRGPAEGEALIEWMQTHEGSWRR